MREKIAKALYKHEHPRGIRKWEEALPFVQERHLNRADVVIQILKEEEQCSTPSNTLASS